MAELRLLPLVLSSVLLLAANRVQCSDGTDALFQSINSYRTSRNLTALKENENAGCLAQKLAGRFKDQPCTNTTGANTVQGTEPRFSDYLNILASCQLNVSDTRDGEIMPACVPNLDPTFVLSNYTKSQYSKYLNDSSFSGIGLGSAENWMVVILTTNTSEGSFVDSQTTSFTVRNEPFIHSLILMGSLILFLL